MIHELKMVLVNWKVIWEFHSRCKYPDDNNNFDITYMKFFYRAKRIDDFIIQNMNCKLSKREFDNLVLSYSE